MTNYEYGFMSKCAEYGVGDTDAIMLYKLAQQRSPYQYYRDTEIQRKRNELAEKIKQHNREEEKAKLQHQIMPGVIGTSTGFAPAKSRPGQSQPVRVPASGAIGTGTTPARLQPGQSKPINPFDSELQTQSSILLEYLKKQR